MFDTERFISEIQNRPCLWNINTEEYSNRVSKQRAWNEIAEILYEDWLILDEKIKTKKVRDLQKKWKGLRDYFNREKNKESALKSGSVAPKKRKTPFLNMLHFLNVIRTTNLTLSNITNEDTDTIPTGADSEDSQSSSSTYMKTKTKKISPFQEALHRSKEKKRDDPDMSFLLNILPDMKSMTPRQNLDFRFEVMKTIKNIKYNEKNDYNEQSPQPSSDNAPTLSPACEYQWFKQEKS